MFFRFFRILAFIFIWITNIIYLWLLDILYLVESTTPTKLFIMFHVLGIFMLYPSIVLRPNISEWMELSDEIKRNFKFYNTCYPLRCQLLFFCFYFYVTFKYSCFEREKLIAYAETHSRQLTPIECAEIANRAIIYSKDPYKDLIIGSSHSPNGRPQTAELTIKASSIHATEKGIYNPYSEVPENAVFRKRYFGFPKFLFETLYFKYKEALEQTFIAKGLGLDINKDPIGQALLREGHAFLDNVKQAHPMYIEEYKLPNGDILFRMYTLTTTPIPKEHPGALYTGFDPKDGVYINLGVLSLKAAGLSDNMSKDTWIQTICKHFVMSQECKEWLTDNMVKELESFQRELQANWNDKENVRRLVQKQAPLLETAALSSDPKSLKDILTQTSQDFRIIAEEKASKIPECTVGNTSNTAYEQNIKQLETIVPKSLMFKNSFADWKSFDLTPNHGLSVEDCSAFNKINVSQFHTINAIISNKIKGFPFNSGIIKTICKSFFS